MRMGGGARGVVGGAGSQCVPRGWELEARAAGGGPYRNNPGSKHTLTAPPDRKHAGPRHEECRGPTQNKSARPQHKKGAPGPGAKSAGLRDKGRRSPCRAPTQRPLMPEEDCRVPTETATENAAGHDAEYGNLTKRGLGEEYRAPTSLRRATTQNAGPRPRRNAGPRPIEGTPGPDTDRRAPTEGTPEKDCRGPPDPDPKSARARRRAPDPDIKKEGRGPAQRPQGPDRKNAGLP